MPTFDAVNSGSITRNPFTQNEHLLRSKVKLPSSTYVKVQKYFSSATIRSSFLHLISIERDFLLLLLAWVYNSAPKTVSDAPDLAGTYQPRLEAPLLFEFPPKILTKELAMLHTQELLSRFVKRSTGFITPIIIFVCFLTHPFPGFGQCTAPSFAPAANFPARNGPFKIAVGDFNGDGKLDLAVPNLNADRVSVLLGNGAGSFTLGGDYPVGSEPNAAAAGDFNGDGKLDLAVVNNSSFGNG